MDNLSLLTYTHSKCVDLHKPYFGRINKYFSSLKNNFVTCNIPVSYANHIPYDDNVSHSEQMINALNCLKTDFIIYSQEDYVLYDYVNIDKINEYINLMSKDTNIGFIRLIKSGVGDLFEIYNDDLWYVDPNNEYFYSTQISIWRRDVLISMFKQSKVNSIFDEPMNSSFLKQMNINGLYTIKTGKQVGGHYNSLIYPYIATAKVKGKWNMSEYSNELNELFNEYKINIK